MTYSYVVSVQTEATPHELRWAWRFTVLARANGRCQWCGAECHLDACHIQSRKAAPELKFDPDNGIALCRSCHMKHDHLHKHRPSGRPLGYRVSEETRRRIGDKNRIANGSAESREQSRQRALAQWAIRGRKHLPRDCANCGTTLTSRQCTEDRRFCSRACHYAFRRGKPRSGY